MTVKKVLKSIHDPFCKVAGNLHQTASRYVVELGCDIVYDGVIISTDRYGFHTYEFENEDHLALILLKYS